LKQAYDYWQNQPDLSCVCVFVFWTEITTGQSRLEREKRGGFLVVCLDMSRVVLLIHFDLLLAAGRAQRRPTSPQGDRV
jgi:hypothetical protein